MGPQSSTNSLPGVARLSADVATRRPRPLPILLRRPSVKLPAVAAGITKRQSRSPSRSGNVDAVSTPDADTLLVFGAISKAVKGSERKRFGLFSHQLARRRRSFGVLDRGARLGDFQRDAAAGIARAGQGQALAQRHRPSIDLQMGTRIVFEKSDDELRAVGAAIAPERLRERGRCGGCNSRNE